MSVPLQIQLFDSFLGSQEGIHSIILPDIFSSGGSVNLFIDKFGRAKKISGYTKQNNTAYLTDTGGSATFMPGVFPYKKNNTDGTVTRQIIGVFDDGVNEWEIASSADSGATWTFRSDLGATAVGQIPDFAQFGNNLYITSGKVAPKVWSGASIATAGSTQSPTPSSASGSAGNLTGNYKWKLVTKNSDGSRKYGSAASTVLSLQSKQASLTWTADADVTAIGYEVYRTTGNGDVFYYVDYVDLRATVAYTDNTTDLTILQNRVLEEHGDAPPTCYYCEPHKQRMWWMRTDTNPTRAYFSDPDLPDSVYVNNNIDFSDSETVGDFITGGLGNYEGVLIVFTERAVWTVSGTGQVIGNIQDWTRTHTNAQTGSVSARSAVRIPAGSKYTDSDGKMQITSTETIAYFTPLNDIRLFDGDNDIIISQPMKTSLSTTNYAGRNTTFALHDSVRSEVAWVYPSGSNTKPSTAVVWNYRWGVWYNRDWGFSSAVEADTSTAAQLLLAGSNSTTTGGYVFQLWNGNSFNGSAINAQWMTKTLYGVHETRGTNYGQPAISSLKRWRWADFILETEQAVTLTVEWLQGNTPDNAASYGSTTITPAAETILDGSGDTILTADGDTLVVSQASSTIRALLQSSGGKYLHDEGIRLRISDNSSNGSWSLEGMNLAYQLMPGLQRRMQ